MTRYRKTIVVDAPADTYVKVRRRRPAAKKFVADPCASGIQDKPSSAPVGDKKKWYLTGAAAIVAILCIA